MYYLATGIKPYNDAENDISLLLHIAQGNLPVFPDNVSESSIPAAYNKIMKACLNYDPTKRPNIKKLQKIFNSWRQSPPFNITNQFEYCDKIKVKHEKSISNITLGL